MEITMKQILILFILLLALNNCGGDYNKNLPNNYKLARTSSSEVSIYEPGGKGIIAPNIDRYAVIGDIVVGYVEKPQPPADLEGSNPVLGYFILNTKTHELLQGYGKEKWLEKLRLYGINEEPKLHRSTYFDRNY